MLSNQHTRRAARQALALAFAACACAPAVQAANNDPVVLVYGFLGFGPETFKSSDWKYWGGFDDLVKHMSGPNGEHRVHAATIGSVSSSWDRAAELFYQIKGGCVDYGSSHTARRARDGAVQKPPGKCWAADPANNPENYPLALHPAWDAEHPIHMIGHSQGAQTIRLLIELLENGSPDGDEGGGALYAGGKINWVKSATTISAPHNGSTLREAMFGLMPLPVAPVVVPAGSSQPQRAPAAAAAFWKQSVIDSVQWEMTPDGAREFNKWVKTSPHVYYFSMANVATEPGSYCCNGTDRMLAPIQSVQFQYPRKDMAPLTKPYAGEYIVPSLFRSGMGSYTQFAAGRVRIDEDWFPNDGVVNTVSMKSPAGHPVRQFDGTAVRGTWNFLTTYRGHDHFDMVGWPRKEELTLPIYDNISKIIYGL
jgi:triacylglycerol lipase